ncbi:MAG: TetR/AcrR family transcriptional regulator [Hyphomicrobiales bacterium]|nr:TetR/AcrR family transcriptional regulator [Hyphomicrobiales bacterium]
MTEEIDNFRQNPQQRRSEDTVEYIFEATAQILQDTDTDEFTTNHIARRAGFSIGTLYRYFPNKQAIMRGMAKREIGRQERRVVDALKASSDRSATDLIRLVARSALHPLGGRNYARRHMLRAMVTDLDLVTMIYTVQRRLFDILGDMLVELDPTRYQKLPETRMVLATGAFAGAVRLTVLNAPEQLETEEFEREFVAMIETFFLKPPCAPG